jgi:hypothetical protein
MSAYIYGSVSYRPNRPLKLTRIKVLSFSEAGSFPLAVRVSNSRRKLTFLYSKLCYYYGYASAFLQCKSCLALRYRYGWTVADLNNTRENSGHFNGKSSDRNADSIREA